MYQEESETKSLPSLRLTHFFNIVLEIRNHVTQERKTETDRQSNSKGQRKRQGYGLSISSKYLNFTYDYAAQANPITILDLSLSRPSCLSVTPLLFLPPLSKASSN